MKNDSEKNYDGGYSELIVTRGDASMLYGLSFTSYTVRFHLKLYQPINPGQMRIAVDKTAKRYPYFCVTLKKNDAEYYYEKNDAPVALLHTREQITLNSEETNGHIWAVCYDDDSLFINFYHGRTDGTGAYFLIATLLYYYLSQQHEIKDCSGIRTLDTTVSEQEIYDPLKDLPLADLSKVNVPPVSPALNVKKETDFQHVDGKGVILRLMIPEESFIPFCQENNASVGIMLCVLLSRAMRRVHPDVPEPVRGNYIINARPMLHAEETYHNCINQAVLDFDRKVENMPLEKQCTVFRGKTFVQSDADRVREIMTLSATTGQIILGLPDIKSKVQASIDMVLKGMGIASYTLSYIGKWKFPQLGKYIKEFWLETTVGDFPVVELSAVNGQVFVSMNQPFSERVYFDALIEELREQGIPYIECGTDMIRLADIVM